MTRRTAGWKDCATVRQRARDVCPDVTHPAVVADYAVDDALFLVDAVRDLDPRELWGGLALWATEDPIRLYAATVALAAMVPADKTVGELLGWTDGLVCPVETRSVA